MSADVTHGVVDEARGERYVQFDRPGCHLFPTTRQLTHAAGSKLAGVSAARYNGDRTTLVVRLRHGAGAETYRAIADVFASTSNP